MTERPLKRPRLSFATGTDDEPGDIDLQEARAQNDQRLKSIFEGIFEKYGKDFTDVGDEIDLQTGKIVVDNGHIQGMEDEDDTGEEAPWLFDTENSALDDAATAHNISQYSETEAGGDLLEEDNTYLQHPQAATQLQAGPNLSGPWESRESEALSAESDVDEDRSSVDSLLDTALSVQNGPDDPVRRKNLMDTDEVVTKKAKPTAETSTQSQILQKHSSIEAVDSVWRVPRISGKFSTPPLSRSRPPVSFNAVRSASPPGAGSIWALPGKSRRTTDITKRRSARKHESSQHKWKPQSSPIMCDWSFAETPDGNESDDPLQENYQPSPTPKGGLKIRGKRLGPDTPSRRKDLVDDCKVSPLRDDPASRLHQTSLNSAEDQRDTTEAANQPETTANNVALDTQLVTKSDTKIHDISMEVTQDPKITPIGYQPKPQDSTSPSKRTRTTITPDEARLIVVLKQVQGKKWKEILDRLPWKKLAQLVQWNHLHWNERRANPPPLSKPWSSTERETLHDLKDQRGLTWHAIRTRLPGRSLAEIEFELLILWVGDDVWNTEQQDGIAPSFSME
ncbi:Myb-like DNA-binding domain protein [Aspergillus bombycis]|uniref:Myb-like DNA-binding domain protein n=1 Tax=Aspergillus bombycis TaxID=109264 RepID=A0A1F8AG51_9EURO|nr:Myb-like DNA-binding domain protein [Aspergillus bombycis]OGM50671.1 Myb-like DNA-binding domain protein [Aspergillus bombycis]